MGWYLFFVGLYIYIAGMFAEYSHNHTCKFKYSILISLVWPVFIFIGVKTDRKVPKYYRDLSE